MAPGAITGLDFSVGNALQRKKSNLSIVVDRLEPPTRGPVYHQLAGLVSDSTSVLQDAIDAEKKNHADAGDDKDAAAEAQARLDRGNALVTTIITFVTSLLTPPAGTAATPIARAEHGARLKQRDCLIVYVRATESGMDVLTSERLLHDTWTAITGVSVEYAIFDSAGHTLTAGTHTVMQRFTGNLKKGLSDLDLDNGQATRRIHDQKVLDVRPFSDHDNARAAGRDDTAAKQITGREKALGQGPRSGSPVGTHEQMPVADPRVLPLRSTPPFRDGRPVRTF